MKSVDVLIVGAGSAGSTAAWKCRELGLSVLLVDAKSRERAGAWWINGVETRLFDELGVAATAPVVFHQAHTFHLQSPGGERVSCQAVPTFEVHMGHLNDRLIGLAEEVGADFWFDTTLESLLIENGVVRGARLHREGKLEAVRARVTVDATGPDGVVRSRLPKMLWAREPVEDRDLCIAAQQVRAIADGGAAQAFLDDAGLRSGEIVSYTGRGGGYSIVNLGVDVDAGHVTILTGAMLSQGQQSAVKLIQDVLDDHPFIGKKISGGAGLIPVRRAFDQLVGEGYALVGTAASQVWCSHGSGVAAGMRAADILAEVVADALRRRSVADTSTLWRYAAAYQTGRGALCAAQELVSRLSESFTTADLDLLIGAGLINAHAVEQSLGCHALRLGVGQVIGAARAALRAPRVTARLLAVAGKAIIVQRHYENYPESWNPAAFAAWRKRTAKLFGVGKKLNNRGT